MHLMIISSVNNERPHADLRPLSLIRRERDIVESTSLLLSYQHHVTHWGAHPQARAATAAFHASFQQAQCSEAAMENIK